MYNQRITHGLEQGIGIESMNDLKEAMFKYASNKGYWRPEIKLSFNLATTTAMLKRDPFYNTYIVFRWCVVKDRQVIPVIGKCRQALEILGITLT